MKIYRLFPILFLVLSLNAFSQGERYKEKKEQIKAMKVAFLTTELKLTSSEAEKFWPIYNAFDDKQFELRHRKMKDCYKRIESSELDNLSEKEAATLLNQIENNDEEIFNLRKKFIANLKGVIPSVKIIKLRKAEEDFNKKLLQLYRERNKNK
jgi:hypothetical protein